MSTALTGAREVCEGRFKSTILDTEPYLMACHRYIEANPLRAMMVALPGEHPWSSWGHNGEGRVRSSDHRA